MRDRDGAMRPGLVALFVGLLFGLAGTGSSAVAVVLPSIAADFGLTTSGAAWLITGYGLSLAVATAVYGRLADLAGIRLSISAGVAIMICGVLLGAVAQSYELLLCARVLQGAGAASVIVLALATVNSKYEGAVRVRALGTVVGVASAVSALGPLAGGLLEVVLTWRGAVALPALGLLLLAPLWREFPTAGTRGRLDLLGAVLVAGTASGLVLLVQSAGDSLTVSVVGTSLLAIGIPAVTAHVRRRPHGFLPHAVITDPVVVRTALSACAVPASWFAVIVAVPIILSDRGWAPVEVGIGLVPAAVIGLIAPPFVASILTRLGPARSLMVVGLFAATALGIFAAGTALGQPWMLIGAVCMVTASFGLVQPSLVASVTSAVPVAVHGAALGMSTLVFLVGGGVGSAVLGGTYDLVGPERAILLVALLPLGGALIAFRMYVRARSRY